MTSAGPGPGPGKASARGRIVLGPDSVSISELSFLAPGAEAELRAFLDRVFSQTEVRSVDLDRGRRLGRIHHVPVADLPGLWRRLGRALRPAPLAGGDGGATLAGGLFLDAPGPLRVSRIGGALSTLRLRLDSPDRLRVGHPLLRRRSHMRFRLEEELAALPGIRSFQANRLTAEVTVWLDPGTRAAERLALALEKSWPRLLAGLEGPPSNRRLAVAGGLFGLAAAGTFAVPALLPVAIAGIAVCGIPNLFAALRELGRGRIGLPALYATGLVFFILTRRPFASTMIGLLTQLWPKLAHDRAIASQRRLLAPWRRRPRWAWLVLEGGEAAETPVERLVAGNLVVVRRGDTVPVDGVVERGLVATVGPGRAAEPTDREPGDAIRAGEFVLDGEGFVRVSQPAARSAAAFVEAQLPHGVFHRLPSLDAAERVANRNARPALALAFCALAVRRQLRPAQGILRPDYLTAPRLGAQLGAQRAFVEALEGGVLLRRPAALDRLAEVEVFVLDDSAPLLEQAVEIGRIVTSGGSDTEILARAAPAFGTAPGRGPVRREAGRAWYRDAAGDLIEVASAAWFGKAGRAFAGPAPERGTRAVRRSVWVLRNGEPLGRIDFRDGQARAVRDSLDRLRATLGPDARILLLSAGPKAAAASLGARLGTDFALGGLDAEEKADVIRGLGRRTAWIGDGTAEASVPAIAASDVSLSTAVPSDAEQADALLLTGLEAILAALAAARGQRAAIAADYRLLYAANLGAVAGALVASFGGLNSGLLSNTGTAAVLARHARGLRALEAAQALRFRKTLESYPAEARGASQATAL